MTTDLLSYYMNREHICEIKLIQKSDSKIVFDSVDGHFRGTGYVGNDPITISVITEDEFETVKRYYEKQAWKKLQTKEDLVKNFIECLGD